MYSQFFGLTQNPFSIAPDPHYLFLSQRHREALAHLLYGLGRGGGFVVLTGEIGAGKTTLCRYFLQQVPAHCRLAYVFNPRLNALELLQTICEEFHVTVNTGPAGQPSLKDCIDALNAYLLAAHGRGEDTVLIIDEAQNLSTEVLEQLRLLTNLETNERKLLQIILIGQPELREVIESPGMAQLAQRVIARFHLGALSETETLHYLAHRLAVSGWHGPLPFDRKATRRIFTLTQGVPRKINLLCDRSLLGAFAAGVQHVDSQTVNAAAAEVFGVLPSKPGMRVLAWPVAAAAVLAVGGVGAWAWYGRGPVNSIAATKAVAVVSPAPKVPASAPLAPPAVAQVAPTARPASPSALQALPPTNTLWQDLPSATGELLALWGIAPADGDPCVATVQQGVACFRTNTNFSVIRQLSRPGVLTLEHPQGQLSYALLTGLDANYAQLTVRGVPQRWPLTLLATVWRGDFATLWRMPPGAKAPWTHPQAERAAPWMRDKLALFFKGQEVALPALDAADPRAVQTAQLRAFQRAQGLESDGLLGPLTVMQLNRIGGVEEPHF